MAKPKVVGMVGKEGVLVWWKKRKEGVLVW